MNESCQLFCGDAGEVLRSLPHASVDALITDPPYGTTEQGKDKLNGIAAGGWTRFGAQWDTELPISWLEAILPVLRPGAAALVFTDTKRTETLWHAFEAYGLHPLQLFFWHKTNPAPNPRKNFASAVESAVFGRKPGKVAQWNGGGFAHNLYTGPTVAASYKRHPTQKPVPLMAHLCGLMVPAGGTVLDPFMGSGSTGVACLQKGYRFIGIERDPRYYATSQRRLSHTQLAFSFQELEEEGAAHTTAMLEQLALFDEVSA